MSRGEEQSHVEGWRAKRGLPPHQKPLSANPKPSPMAMNRCNIVKTNMAVGLLNSSGGYQGRHFVKVAKLAKISPISSNFSQRPF